MPYGTPDIHIIQPFKERLAVVGMVQEGKTNFLEWLMSQCTVKYTCFDSIGVIARSGFKPTKPDIQQIITPKYSTRQTEFDEACKTVWKEGNQIFIIDEVSDHCTKWEIPPAFDIIVTKGGNRNIGLWVTTQRPAQVHNNILAGCKHHIIFRTYLPQDVEWYKQVVPKDIIMESQQQAQYHFIYYKLGGQPQFFKPVKDMSK
jgi:hypothetical protein